MKKKLVLLALYVSVFLPGYLAAQNVTVAGAVVGNGTYPDLASAFTAINGGAQTLASITVSITGNTVEPATATLNQNTWLSLTLQPSGGATRTISGNIAGPLIDFNGADRVLVDGLNTGGNALIVDNSSTAATASTIRFINDARILAVQNATVLGASTSTTSGTILLSTAATQGNDSIALNLLTVANSAAGFPVNGIASIGTATAGQENSNVTISGCLVSNYFSASQLTVGILANAGNTDWTVQNCRLFQTASRTYTTANIHKGIQILGGNNHLIQNNVIGFASAVGTGTYTMTGTIATRMVGIELSAGTAVASSIQGNTVSGFSLTTSSGATTANGIFCGISVTGGNVNVGTVAGNTIGAATGTGSILTTSTTTGGLLVGLHSSSTGQVVISNNTAGSMTALGSSNTVGASLAGIVVSGGASNITVSNNTIGNNTASNLVAGTAGCTSNSLISGIFLSAATAPAVATVSGNTVQNLLSNGTGTTGYARGIQTGTATAASSAITVSGNLIFNLNCNSSNPSMANGQTAVEGIHVASFGGVTITGNIINTLSATNAGAFGTVVAGIGCAASTVTPTLLHSVTRNQIYDLRNASTGTTATTPPVACGILVRSGITTMTMANNMISLGAGQSTNTSFMGFYFNHGSTPNPLQINVYHNTVNIEGTAAAGALPTFGLHRGDFTGTRTIPITIQNNVFVNTRTGGTGLHFAIGNNHLIAATPAGWSSNNNVLNANAANVGSWGGTLDFATWQATTSWDASSFSGVSVPFVNPAVCDLHVNFGLTPTVLESSGLTIAAVTTDFDSQVRPGPAGSVNGAAFAPDLGADEFDGVYLDAAKPVITYTPFTFTCSTGDRSLTATLTDLSGVPTSGGLMPRIYFRKNAGTWFSSAGTLSAGTATNGTWNFTISAATLGGLVIGDVVDYFVIAQDVASPSNITSSPATGLVASDVNTVTTAPATPNSYAVSGFLAGPYTVGAGGNYTTLTAAVNAYNTSCLNGPVTFLLTDATYPAETFPISILQNPDASATNTLTIKPNTGVSAVISGSSATYLLGITGGDFVTIDGSNGSTVNSVCPRVQATRDLTFTNTNTATGSGVVTIMTHSSGNAALNNAIMNCVVVGSGPAATGVGINLSGPGVGAGTGATGNHNNSIVNNEVRACQVGIFSAGSGAPKNNNNTFNLNVMNNTAANAVGRVGIMILNEDAAVVHGNTIANIVNTASTDVIGISLGSNAAANTLTVGGEVTNASVMYNTVDSLVQTNTFSAVGINLAATSTGTCNVTNNFVTNVFCNGTTPDMGAGIYYGGGAGALNVYHNTVHVTGATLTGGTQPNYAIGINGTTPVVDIRNNILLCSGENGANRNTGIALAYTSTTGNYTNLTSENNDIFVSGTTGAAVGQTGGLGTAGTQRVTLADWRTETGRDLVSQNVAVTPNGTRNYHLTAAANPTLVDVAAVLPAVTSDIDCESRSCAPDIGADEFGTNNEVSVEGNQTPIVSGDVTPDVTDRTDMGTISACTTATATFWIYNTGVVSMPVNNVSLSGSSDFSITTPAASSIAAGDSSSFTVTFTPSAAGTASTTVSISTPDCDEGTYTFTVQAAAVALNVVTNGQQDVSCNGGNDGEIMVTGTGLGTVSYLWSNGDTDNIAQNLIAGSYSVIVSDTACADTLQFVIAEPTAVLISLASNADVSCFGGNDGMLEADASGGTPGYSYLWSNGVPSSAISNLTAGSYDVTVTDGNGCEAVATYVVNEPALITFTQNPSVCAGGSVTVGGNTYTASGTYVDTLTTAGGCDSIVTTNLTVAPALDLTTSGVDPVITANQAGAAYQWIDCGTGQALNGETSQSFTAQVTGSYACVITVGSCSDTTACDSVIVVARMQMAAGPAVSVFPNPNRGEFRLLLEEAAEITISNTVGEIVGRYTLPAGTHDMNLHDRAAGVYYLQATAGERRTVVKVVVQ